MEISKSQFTAILKSKAVMSGNEHFRGNGMEISGNSRSNPIDSKGTCSIPTFGNEFPQRFHSPIPIPPIGDGNGNGNETVSVAWFFKGGF
jgi:hypothetical protein